MKQLSIKQRIYRVAYAVIGFATLVATAVGVSLYAVGYYTHKTDSASQGLRFINRSEMNYAYDSAAIRGYLLDSSNKKEHAAVNDYAKSAIDDLKLADAQSDDDTVHKLVQEVIIADKATDEVEERMWSALEAGDHKTAEKIYISEHGPKMEVLKEHLTSVRKKFAESRDAAIASREMANLIDTLLMAVILLVSTAAIVTYSFRLAKTISSMLENISKELSDAAGSVGSVSGGVSTASHALSEATTQQAAAIEETVSSMEEMSSMLAQTSQNAQATLVVSEEGQQEGERGKAVIAKMLTAMDEIHESNGRLETIVKMIEQIQSKTKVINDIVFETRLLSFNASIEAARAGAHGKGFAVVAEEVGKLAAMSGKAAEEIRTLLETSTAEVSSVVRGTQDRVNAGRQVSQDCQVVFEVMSNSLEKIGGSVRMITAATKEQEQGVKQTNQAMGEMDQVTQKNSASAEALSNQSARLSDGANLLIGSVGNLRSVIFGSETTTPSAVVAPTPKNAFEIALPLQSDPEPKVVRPLKAVSNDHVKSAELERSDSRWKVS